MSATNVVVTRTTAPEASATTTNERARRLRTRLLLAGGALLGLSVTVSAGHVLLSWRQLRRARRPGRETSRQATIMTSPDAPPRTSFTHKGRSGDPINVEIIGSDRQIAAAFAAAGWYRADEIDLVTSARISWDSILGRRYSTAPVSSLFLFGRKEDLAFERPGASVRERDHIRLWDSGIRYSDGRPIWIGGATRDISVELAKTNHLPTHKIASDVDAERDLVVSELGETQLIAHGNWHPKVGTPTQATNGEGDSYTIDGRVAMLTLADVSVPSLVTQIRGPVAARLVRVLATRLRPLLPERQHWTESQPQMAGPRH
jgi:hypothetical protein